MKRIIALTLCLCMALSLAACDASHTAAPSAPSGSSAAGTDPADGSASADRSASQSVGAESSAAPVVTGEPNVALEKVTDTVMDKDGTVLVNYEYQKATVTLPDAEAQRAVQADVDAELQIFLDFVAGELTDYAKDTLSYDQEADLSAVSASASSDDTGFQPYYAQYIITPARVDNAVVSLVVDNVSYSGGAHGSDNRYCLNYDSKSGQRLTFELLGKDFRSKSEELVLAKAETVKDQLDEGYAAQLPFVVSDGTESVDEVNRKVYPDLYEDTSIAPESGTLNAEFYLNDKGVMFIVGEYVMKAYAGGILEYGFSYDKYGEAINPDYVIVSEKSQKKEKEKDNAGQQEDASADAGAEDGEE